MAPADKPRKQSGRAPERRNEQARLAVLHAADDLLAERGYDGVTIEGIAARANVAKQTIYRWWPSKGEILLETLREDAEKSLAVAPGKTVRRELLLRLRRLVEFLEKDPAGLVLLALIGQAQHDGPAAARLQEEFFAEQREQDHARLKRGVESGELPADLHIEDALDALYGPVYFRALVTHERMPRSYLDRLVESVLGGDA
jgi:AcrR family transcriptional regulator